MEKHCETSAVSVVIPIYNGAAFLKSALASILRQKLPPREIVAVDDASTDESCALLGAMAGETQVPIRIIRLARNSGGPAHPINVGIGASCSEFIAVLDQDDVLLPGHLQLLVGALQRDPELVFAFAGCLPMRRGPANIAALLQRDTFGRVRSLAAVRGHYRVLDGNAAAGLLLVHGNYAMGYPGFVFRRRHLQRKGGVDESLRICSDYDLLCWLSLQGLVGCVPRPLYLKREHAGNVARPSVVLMQEMLEVTRRYIPQLADTKFSGGAILLARRLLMRRLTGLAWCGSTPEAARMLWTCYRRWGFNGEVPWSIAKLLCIGCLNSVAVLRGTPSDPQFLLVYRDLMADLLGFCTRMRLRDSPPELRPLRTHP
jgi:hypothetical protein